MGGARRWYVLPSYELLAVMSWAACFEHIIEGCRCWFEKWVPLQWRLWCIG